MMATNVCVSIRFLQPYFHGRGEDDEPEWPPSPLRVVQALVAASAGRWNERTTLSHAAPALRWFESLSPPRIVAAGVAMSERPYRLYVPDNVGDKVAASWSRTRDASIGEFKIEKDVRPVHLDGDTVYYVFPLQGSKEEQEFIETLRIAARSMTHLGWGIDMVAANVDVLTDEQVADLPGQHWVPCKTGGNVFLRTPVPGTLEDLTRRHRDFLNCITESGVHFVPPLHIFRVVRYRRQDEPVQRPYRVFELRTSDGSRFRYSHRRLIHIAGMLRHLAIETMKKSPPSNVGKDWVETYVAGHRGTNNGHEEHRQLSYIPLPSVGHEHTDPGVRRVMLVAPVGDDALLDHVARRLAWQVLRPLRGVEFPADDPPILVPVRHDNVVRFYTARASVWHSLTPVILPGYDDHKPSKTCALIERALWQSGITQPCDFEWSAFSRFAKAYSAHKYDRYGRPQGYFRPSHLLNQPAVHLTIRFRDDIRVPGPMTIGAGRHCGFGLMVGEHGP